MTLTVSAYELGGAGADGFGVNGSNGANAIMDNTIANPTNAAVGFTTGNLTLIQTAEGGSEGGSTVYSVSYNSLTDPNYLTDTYNFFNDTVIPLAGSTTQLTVTLDLTTGTGGDGFLFSLETTATPQGPPPMPPAVITGSMTTPVLTGSSYSSVIPVTANGGLGTTVSIIDGVASSAKMVTLASTNMGGNFSSLASDVFSVSGNAGDKFTLQISFSAAQAALFGGAANMRSQTEFGNEENEEQKRIDDAQRLRIH